MSFKSFPETEWIFFSSSNGVEHFFNQLHEFPNCKFAAIGQATAKTLNRFAKVDFVGEGNPNQVALSFKQEVKEAKVLFPIAEDSLKSIQSIFSENQVENLIVYRTKLKKNLVVKESDVVIFTSPSNVNGFFLNTNLTGNEKVIAIGDSTHAALKKKGVNAKVAFTPSEVSLITEVFS